jgi:hypothetical protein
LSSVNLSASALVVVAFFNSTTNFVACQVEYQKFMNIKFVRMTWQLLTNAQAPAGCSRGLEG